MVHAVKWKQKESYTSIWITEYPKNDNNIFWQILGDQTYVQTSGGNTYQILRWEGIYQTIN